MGHGNRRGPLGSSPRVRGTQALVHLVDAHLGIIPACAGNTPRRCRRSRPTRDHPRVCGEHSTGVHVKAEVAESSPRVRGTPGFLVSRDHQIGIIPACAGNTWRTRSSAPSLRDHPRVCGEHHHVVQLVGVPQGSSPRVRGTRIRHVIEPAVPGIIPACAGNTQIPAGSWLDTRDHPRVCRAHALPTMRKRGCPGSSPRVRGTRSKTHPS